MVLGNVGLSCPREEYGFASSIIASVEGESRSSSFDGLVYDNVGVGLIFVVKAALPGLGNVGMNIELKLTRFMLLSDLVEVVDKRLLSCRKFIEESVGESAVSEATKLLGRIFSCGSNVEVLGGRGDDGNWGNGPMLELN
jgi:hypothetical protein